MAKQTKAGRLAQAARYIAAIEKYADDDTVLQMGGATFTKAQMLSRLRENTAKAKTTADARVAFKAAVAAERKDTRDLAPLIKLIKAWARWFFPPEIAEDVFEVLPPGPGYKSPETYVRAAEKARATRAARGTLAKQQRRQRGGI